MSNFWDTTPVSAYTYGNDALGRRTARDDFDGSVVTANAFGYNQRSEVTNAVMGSNTYGYGYDPIGNRKTASASGELSGLSEYSANSLNQYTAISNGQSAVSSPTYDADGNMLSNGDWSFTWDGENRLASVMSNSVLVVTNVYDHMSRRIAKIAGGTQYTFLYDGWNPIRETVQLDALNSLTNYYTWGLDLSGSLQGAGGVGGLLAVTATGPNQPNSQNTYYPLYDANGNVTAYADGNGAVVARREFDAFGETIAQSGPMAADFAYWFSTKYLDPETGLFMYQLRPYSPHSGLWISRDPIEEEGGLNLYSFTENNPQNRCDAFGLFGEGRIKMGGEYIFEVIYYDDGQGGSWLRKIHVPSGHSDFTGGDFFDFVKEDTGWTHPWNPIMTGNHFLPPAVAKQHIEAAVSVCPCDTNKFERAMHQLQDTFSHYEKKYRYKPFLKLKNLGMGHAFAGLFGDDPDDDEEAWKKAEEETVRTLKETWDVKCGSRKK